MSDAGKNLIYASCTLMSVARRINDSSSRWIWPKTIEEFLSCVGKIWMSQQYFERLTNIAFSLSAREMNSKLSHFTLDF